MAGSKPFVLNVNPGIKRDGTQFQGNNWVDGGWTRFNRLGRPRKQNGYRIITEDMAGPIRGMHARSRNGATTIHAGHPNGIQSLLVSNQDGSMASGIVDRTPVGFVVDSANSWSIDAIYDSFGTAIMVLAHAVPDGLLTDADINRKMWMGPLNATSVLVDSTGPQCSGGVVVLHPYVFLYGSDGRIDWSDPGLPGTWPGTNTARICENKIIRGLPMRGGNSNSPAGLFWSLTSLERAVFNPGGTPTFKFDTLSDDTSLLSKHCVVEFDGVFYWLGVNRFQMYNGVVRELPNNMNINYLFDHLNKEYSGRSFAYTVPHWSEIRWVVPVDGSTEPNHEFVYNVALQTWYDTPYQGVEVGRGAFATSKVFTYPLLGGVRDLGSGKYELWQHETASYNKVTPRGSEAIQSFVESSDVSFAGDSPINTPWAGDSRNIRTYRFEPDFNQVGNLKVTAVGRGFAQAQPIERTQISTPTTKALDDLRYQARQTRWRFESNVLDGFYEVGNCLIHIEPGDDTPIQP